MKADTKTFMLGLISSIAAGFLVYSILTSKNKSSYSMTPEEIKEERSMM